MTTVKRPRREKTSEPNLYRIGRRYYYRRGDDEKVLGDFASEAKAIEFKRIFVAKRDSVGALAYKFKLHDLYPDYLNERRNERDGLIPGRKRISANTYKECEELWDRHLKSFFGSKRYAEIDDILWQKYVRTKRLADLTNHRKVLKTHLKWALRNGYLKGGLPLLEIPRIARRMRRLLQPNEIKAILENSHDWLLLYVSMELFMGMRRSEQIRLAWRSVDFERKAIVIEENTTRMRKRRVIPINPFVLRILKRQLADQADLRTAWVYPKRGRPKEHRDETGLTKAWQTMLKAAGLSDIQPHDLRATFEHYASKRSDFTDTQREKMAGASMDVQRRVYLTGYDADDLRGLEDVVQVEGLTGLLDGKITGVTE